MRLRGIRHSRGHGVRPSHQHPAPTPNPRRGSSAYGEAASSRQDAKASLTVTDNAPGDVRTIALRGVLDLHSVAILEDVIARVWNPAITALTLDLRGLTFIDSCGLWTITTVNKWCARGKVKLEMIPGPESVHSVFELTGLSDVLPFGQRDGLALECDRSQPMTHASQLPSSPTRLENATASSVRPSQPTPRPPASRASLAPGNAQT